MVVDSKSELLSAAQAAVADQREKSKARPVRRTGIGLLVLRLTLAGLLIAGASILIIRPPWLVGQPPPEETPAIRASSVRLALLFAAGRVTAFHESRGRLPVQLSDAGVTDQTIEYQRVGEGQFRLSRTAGDSVVTVQSTDSLKDLAIHSLRTLQGR